MKWRRYEIWGFHNVEIEVYSILESYGGGSQVNASRSFEEKELLRKFRIS